MGNEQVLKTDSKFMLETETRTCEHLEQALLNWGQREVLMKAVLDVDFEERSRYLSGIRIRWEGG